MISPFIERSQHAMAARKSTFFFGFSFRSFLFVRAVRRHWPRLLVASRRSTLETNDDQILHSELLFPDPKFQVSRAISMCTSVFLGFPLFVATTTAKYTHHLTHPETQAHPTNCSALVLHLNLYKQYVRWKSRVVYEIGTIKSTTAGRQHQSRRTPSPPPLRP